MLLAKEGAKVVIGDILDNEGKRVEAQVAELGGEATYVHLDVTSADNWDAAVQTALDRYGRLDILVNNAGILGPRTGMEETTSEQWDAVLEVNAKGAFLGTKAAIPALRDAGGGSIINISSIAGIIADPTGIPAYQASKGAIRLLTKSTAIQYAADNIRCNSVHPGLIVTAMSEDVVLPTPTAGRHSSAAFRSAGSAPWRISPTASCSSPQTNHPSSQAASLS